MEHVAPLDSIEELREALLSATRERDDLAHAYAHARHLLDALESLLRVDSEEDPFERVFAALHRVFTFSQAMVLADCGTGELECIVGNPATLAGSSWRPGALFTKVLNGRVVSTFSSVDVEEWREAASFGLSSAQSALYIPVRVREQRGILALLRPGGDAGFDRKDVEAARKFAVLASHALATRYATQTELESRRLRELTAQLRASEHEAQRNAGLLEEIVELLPVGVAVQDENGAYVLVNDAAAAAVGQQASELLGKTCAAGALEQRTACLERLRDDAPISVEHAAWIGDSMHTLLTTYKPVRISEERLLLSATLDITERKRFEQELTHRAFHDQLTGLPNRVLMAELVDAAIRQHRRGGMFALAFIDVDNFKQVNDYYSHAAGDALLIGIGERIRENLRAGDTVARISGDEFLVLVNPVEKQSDLQTVVERIVAALKQPFHIEGREVLTSASLGASVFPLHGENYETLRRSADSAMYRAKKNRKGCASYFDASMEDALSERMELEQRLRAAVRERDFRVAYQPKVDTETGKVIGFEALARWVEPGGKVHMPGTFIDLATELGLLDDITRLVLGDVAKTLPQLTEWYGPGVSVSLNLSARQAGDAQFMSTFVSELAASGVAERIIVELTEDALVAKSIQREILPALRALGTRVSIDDFGTGYSSLSTLTDITADEVKVDRAFIASIHTRVRSQGILKAIESLCSALDVTLVAEGVESPEELAYLRANSSIRFAQGYYFGRPQFVEQLAPEVLEVA